MLKANLPDENIKETSHVLNMAIDVIQTYADAQEDEEYDDYEDDADEIGYNPYLGCYDDDC